ncbi:hypothetical protein Tco_1378180 [Tanacetum coccineum]
MVPVDGLLPSAVPLGASCSQRRGGFHGNLWQDKDLIVSGLSMLLWWGYGMIHEDRDNDAIGGNDDEGEIS